MFKTILIGMTFGIFMYILGHYVVCFVRLEFVPPLEWLAEFWVARLALLFIVFTSIVGAVTNVLD